ALLAVLANVVAQPLVDDLGKLVQLGPLDRRRPPIPRRYRKAQHLLHALARNPKMTCRLARTHPVPTAKTHLQIQFHGENAPALPAERKGKSGRVLLRQLRDYPAATVADFSTAVLNSGGHDYQRPGGTVRAPLEDVQQGQGPGPDGEGYPIRCSSLA